MASTKSPSAPMIFVLVVIEFIGRTGLDLWVLLFGKEKNKPRRYVASPSLDTTGSMSILYGYKEPECRYTETIDLKQRVESKIYALLCEDFFALQEGYIEGGSANAIYCENYKDWRISNPNMKISYTNNQVSVDLSGLSEPELIELERDIDSGDRLHPPVNRRSFPDAIHDLSSIDFTNWGNEGISRKDMPTTRYKVHGIDGVPPVHDSVLSLEPLTFLCDTCNKSSTEPGWVRSTQCEDCCDILMNGVEV